MSVPSVKDLAARYEAEQGGTSQQGSQVMGGGRVMMLDHDRDQADTTRSSGFVFKTLEPWGSDSGSGSTYAQRARSDVEMKPLLSQNSSRPELGDDDDDDGTTVSDHVSVFPPLPPGQPARFLSKSGAEMRKRSAPDSVSGLSQPPMNLPSDTQAELAACDRSESSPTGSESARLAVQDEPHKPLPMSQLFARNAAPLHLPELDEHIARLPKFKFSHSTGPFPPYKLLKGQRLKDLWHNRTPTSVWRDWNSVGSTLVNLALSVMGSSAIATFYSLAGLYNAVQIFALILNTIVGNASGRWQSLFLGTIPNVLALNFGGKLLQSITFLAVLTSVCVGLLVWFYKLTSRWSPDATPEGLISRSPDRGTRAVPFVSFVLTVLYLPLSTISVHAITWADDFWPVDNPYKGYNGTEKPQLPHLGPSSVYHDPHDFCWTTTMRKDEINYAPAAVVLAALTLIFMTIWFPIRLASTIKKCLPIVEPFDALGQRRSAEELETEYQRLLERDKSPFSFLYNEYRRKWGSFKAFYLGVKLASLLIVAIISPDSCLTLSITRRHVSRDALEVARQAVLLVAMILFLLVQSFAAPLIDPVSNASEWTSRMNFVLTSLLGLLVALKIPGQRFWSGWALYLVYIITYGLTTYFTVINWAWMHRVVKRLARRVDFSIDIFSPRLDTSPDSRHLVQRIWQESWSMLLLASPQCRMPASQDLIFVEGTEVVSDEPAPPYLLGFAGSPAERHVENIKILREIGERSYERALTLSRGNPERITILRHKIQRYLIGPDAFWRPMAVEELHGNSSEYFGNAWCIPFPLTVIIRYDNSGAMVSITNLGDLEEFVNQNESRGVEKQKEIRMALRSLDNAIVKWPHSHTQYVGKRWSWFGGRSYSAVRTTDYYQAALSIHHNGVLDWDGINLASGFTLSLRYSKNLVLDGSSIGLNADLELTPQLARFLLLNKHTLDSRLPSYLAALRSYRDHNFRESEAKLATLSYGFLGVLYASPVSPESVLRLLENEPDLRVRDLGIGYTPSLVSMDERMCYVKQGALMAWWFIYWVGRTLNGR